MLKGLKHEKFCLIALNGWKPETIVTYVNMNITMQIFQNHHEKNNSHIFHTLMVIENWNKSKMDIFELHNDTRNSYLMIP